MRFRCKGPLYGPVYILYNVYIYCRVCSFLYTLMFRATQDDGFIIIGDDCRALFFLRIMYTFSSRAVDEVISRECLYNKTHPQACGIMIPMCYIYITVFSPRPSRSQAYTYIWEEDNNFWNSHTSRARRGLKRAERNLSGAQKVITRGSQFGKVVGRALISRRVCVSSPLASCPARYTSVFFFLLSLLLLL